MCFSKVEKDYASNFNFHILYVLARMVFIERKRKIGHNLAPTYKVFVAFSLRTSQNTLKTKDKKARTASLSHYAGKTARKKTRHCRTMPRKRPGKNTSHSKNGKNGHFAKAIAKQNGHKGSILGLGLKITKTYRNHPLKSSELFYSENCSKTHLILEK